MKKRYIINPENEGTCKVVNVEAPTEKEIKLKLFNYIIDTLDIDIDNVLDDLAYNGYFDYHEVVGEDDNV